MCQKLGKIDLEFDMLLWDKLSFGSIETSGVLKSSYSHTAKALQG